ncbi:hypothetical protein SASPL_124786 [Salvia splendens]|uniref:Uncharacterized protein n=2 Tax=Salvia splendens TaxID=180675 RepID=A0A8X8XFX0_SALSN|nr:hypothetical protein SASPL_124786 [Salvia splendens]
MFRKRRDGLVKKANEFMDFRDEERKRRMTRHEGLVKQMVQGEMENLEKLKNAIQLKESQQLVVKSMQMNSFNGFGIDQLNAMNSFADHMLKKLQQRDNELNGK